MKKREQLLAEAKLRQVEIAKKNKAIKGYTGAVRTSWEKCGKERLLSMGYHNTTK